MSEEDIVGEIKKARGWPKGKPRGTRKPDVKAAADRAEARAAGGKWKLKARPNWEGDDFIGVGHDEVDRLRIPADIVEMLHRDGYALQWATKSVRGQETPQELAKFTRGGWTPVHQSDFGGMLDGMFMSKGHDEPIVVDDCILVTRPVEINIKAKMSELRAARRPTQIIEENIGTRGIPNVTGGGHVTARRGNAINKTVERIEIPE